MLGSTGRRALLALAMVAVAFTVIATDRVASQSGDLVYTGDEQIERATMPVNGNVILEPGANVTLIESQIAFQGSGSAVRTLHVKPGALLTLVDSGLAAGAQGFDLKLEGTLVLTRSEAAPVRQLTVGSESTGLAVLEAVQSEVAVNGAFTAGSKTDAVRFERSLLNLTNPQTVVHSVGGTRAVFDRSAIESAGAGLQVSAGGILSLDESTATTVTSALVCRTDSLLQATDAQVRSNGLALDAEACGLGLRRVLLNSTGTGHAAVIAASNAVVDRTRVEASSGKGVLIRDAVTTSLDRVVVAAAKTAMTVERSLVDADRPTLLSTAGGGLVCKDAALTWDDAIVASAGRAVDADGCTGRFRDLFVFSEADAAVRWAGGPSAPLEAQDFNVTASGGVAFYLTASAALTNGVVDAAGGAIEWYSAGDAGAALESAPAHALCYHDADSNGVRGLAEGMFLVFRAACDAVTAGDLRLTPNAAYAPAGGLPVAASDDDVESALAPLGASAAFRAGSADSLYLDVDGDGFVAEGDVRVLADLDRPVMTHVGLVDPDVGRLLGDVPSGVVTYLDVDDDGAFGPVDVAYFDADGDGVAGDDDVRLSHFGNALPAGQRAAANEALVSELTARIDGNCYVCVYGGVVRIESSTFAGDDRVGVGANRARVSLDRTDLSKAERPLELVDASVIALDSNLAPDAHALTRSRVVAVNEFRPHVVFRNDAPVAGASVTIKDASGTVLSTGTTDETGRGPTRFVTTLIQDDSAKAVAGDLSVAAALGELDNETTLSPLVAAPKVVLWDEDPPSDLAGLQRTAAANGPRVRMTWSEAQDAVSNVRYEVRLERPEGHTQILQAGVFVDYAGEVVDTVAGTGHAFDLPGQGAFIVRVAPLDASGTRGASQTLEAVWDAEAPAVSFRFDEAEASDRWHRAPVRVDVVAEEKVSYVQSTRLVVSGVPSTATDEGFLVGNDGEHALEAVVEDAAGNQGSATGRVRVDTTPPLVPQPRLAETVAKQPTRTTLRWDGAPTDAMSGVAQLRLVATQAGAEERLVNRFLAPFPTEVRVDVLEGVTEFVLVAVDAAGNEARSGVVRFLVDGEGPRLAQAPTALEAGVTQLRVAFEDASGVVSVLAYVDGRLWASSTNATILVDLADVGAGAHDVRLVATDEAGNAAEYTLTVNVGGKNGVPGPAAAALLAGLAVAALMARRIKGRQ